MQVDFVALLLASPAMPTRSHADPAADGERKEGVLMKALWLCRAPDTVWLSSSGPELVSTYLDRIQAGAAASLCFAEGNRQEEEDRPQNWFLRCRYPAASPGRGQTPAIPNGPPRASQLCSYLPKDRAGGVPPGMVL